MDKDRRRRSGVALLRRHWPRILITLLPLVFALLHASQIFPLDALSRLDKLIYDTRLRATMPRTLDERIVIIDIDEKSLAETGQWPWARDRLAALTEELFTRQHIALLGFDTVFAEPDTSSGLPVLRQLAQGNLRDNRAFAERLRELEPRLDHDGRFARALRDRSVVMGYYFTSDRQGHRSGVLPVPVSSLDVLGGRNVRMTHWDGYGANIAGLAAAAPLAGFFNAVADSDGVVRSAPMLAELDGQVYESLALAMFRRLADSPRIESGPDGLILRRDRQARAIPVDNHMATLVPFRGPGGAQGGSFRYYAASDVLAGRLPPDTLKGKVAFLGATAPGLVDLRSTPVGDVYPGVETHASTLAGLLDGRIPVRPDYAAGFEVATLLLAGMVLAFGLTVLPAGRAVVLSVTFVAALAAFHSWLYLAHGLVLPLASALIMAVIAFALNMSYGYLVESRAKRQLARLFGTYVPPELVGEMVKEPKRYSMRAETRMLTVMFCDMHGFTRLSESMAPEQLQRLLNEVFSRLTRLIRARRGTIDKYMGDAIMAFWGAPIATVNHAAMAVDAALDMAAEMDEINRERAARGQDAVHLGIGLNTGTVCVGDMGSDVRRSYTVIGDTVNLASRLEGLSRHYGVPIVAGEATRHQAPDFVWRSLDRVRVKGREQAVSIFQPLAQRHAAGIPPVPATPEAMLETWDAMLAAYRAQEWPQCAKYLTNLLGQDANNCLYRIYAQRVALHRLQPYDPRWDGATDFETK